MRRAGKVHKAGVDTPESVVAIAEYPEDFIGVFSVNYAAMQYKSRNDQLNQLDGDQARMDIGREDLKVFEKGAEERSDRRKTFAEGFRVRDRPARAKFSGLGAYAKATHRTDANCVSGCPGSANGEHLAKTREAHSLECGDAKSRVLTGTWLRAWPNRFTSRQVMLVLASQSPRRKEILANAGIPFIVRPPQVLEQRKAWRSCRGLRSPSGSGQSEGSGVQRHRELF